MSYLVMARKWRPQNFTDVVGQEHITQTLSNALKNGRLPHALLFTGPRGTGKTSSARILAKSLRCPNAVDFVPCDQCPSCEEISQGRSVDVIEIDGASNNGVDSIRELRDSVNYRPSSGKYKVYIIDEVHMLSTSAFNALLKTLEEPPPHVIFVMATTEAHKIPATILSRCQRFDFRRIPTRLILQHLKNICVAEGISAQDEALWLVARQGDGSMRDSQSLLDQVITFAQGPLSTEVVTHILGLTDRTLLFETLTAVLDRNNEAVVTLLRKIHQTGLEPSLFSQELLEMFRHALMVKVAGADVTQLVNLPDSELNRLVEISTHVTEEDLHLLFDMSLKGAQDIARAHDPALVLEMLLLRLVISPTMISLKSMFDGSGKFESFGKSLGTFRPEAQISRGGSLPAATKNSNPNSTSNSTPASRTSLGNQSPSELKRAPPSSTVSISPSTSQRISASLSPSERWLSFIEKSRNEDALFAAKLENLLFLKEENKKIFLGVPAKLVFLKEQMSDAKIRQKFQTLLETYWAPGMTLDVQILKESQTQGESAQSMNLKKQIQAEEDLKQHLAEHPMVKAAQSVFKGQIKSISAVKNQSRERGKP